MESMAPSETRLSRRHGSFCRPAAVSLSFRRLPTFSSSPVSDLDLDLISLKPQCYTSLKDLLPCSAVSSPRANSPSQSGCEEISIRNRLVQQAAWAYLQPMSTAQDSSGGFFSRIILAGNRSVSAFTSCLSLHVFQHLRHGVDWLLRVVHLKRS